MRIGNYVNIDTHIEWKCLNCNENWFASPYPILNANVGCPICNFPGKSKNEIVIKKLLQELYIDFKYQYSIRDFKDIKVKPYRFDFYFPDSKIALEYNGAQHYRPSTFGTQTKEEAEICFQKQLKRDEYVRNFCKENGIKLIEIDGRKYQNKKLKAHMTDDILPLITQTIENKTNLTININNCESLTA